jgi:hypothetical protein
MSERAVGGALLRSWCDQSDATDPGTIETVLNPGHYIAQAAAFAFACTIDTQVRIG